MPRDIHIVPSGAFFATSGPCWSAASRFSTAFRFPPRVFPLPTFCLSDSFAPAAVRLYDGRDRGRGAIAARVDRGCGVTVARLD